MTDRTNQRLLLTAATSVCGLLLAGCLGGDPNKNSMCLFDTSNPGCPNGSASGAGGSGAGGSGAGGSGGGSATGAIVGTPLATFDTTTQGYQFSMYDEPTNLAVHNDGTPPTITWDDSDGSPSGGGSLQVTAPFSGANQYVDVQSPSFGAANLQNLAGGKLHVRVRVDPGSTFNGQIEPYVDTTTAYSFVGTSIQAGRGNDWQDYVVDLDGAMTRISGYDLTKVILIGVHIGSGSAGASATPVTFHIDSFSVEGGSPTVGGTPDAGGGGSDAGSSSDAATD